MTVKKIDESYGSERAFFGVDDIEFENCRFEGEEDGESALKECGRVAARDCKFALRYPLWHDGSVLLENCVLTDTCRAALWYSKNIVINDCKLLGIKALRECEKATVRDCEIVSPEFGWSTDGLMLIRSHAKSEYFLLRAKNIYAQELDFKGKYSFQYVKNAKLSNCKLDTKDAFWHAENVTVENSVIVGEYLGWYSKNLTFKRCTIVGTQPLCYCKNLKLIDCVMANADRAFEKSEVHANLLDDIVSIKNPYKGVIVVPAVGEIIRDDIKSKAAIMIDPEMRRRPENGV